MNVASLVSLEFEMSAQAARKHTAFVRTSRVRVSILPAGSRFWTLSWVCSATQSLIVIPLLGRGALRRGDQAA